MALVTGDMLVGGVLDSGDMFDGAPVFSSPSIVNANNWGPVQYQAVVTPSDAVVTLVAPVLGVSWNQGTKIATLTPAEPGSFQFTLRATKDGVSTDLTVSVVVDGRPVFFNPATLNIAAGTITPIVIEARDPEGATLTLSAIQMPSGLVFTPAAQPSTTGNGLVYTGTITGSLIGGAHACVIRATAANGGGSTDFALTINAAAPANQAPVITSSPTLAVNQGQSVQRTLTGTDANGDLITWTLSSAHNWITLQGNQVTAAPGGGIAPGVYQAVVTAGDGSLSTNQTLNVTVLASPGTGVVPDSTPRERTISVNRDGSVTYQPLFQDPLATLDYRVDLSKWLAASDSVASLTFSEDGDMEIAAQASDLSGGTVLLRFGADRSQYQIVAQAMTAQGRVYVLRFFVHVIAWVM